MHQSRSSVLALSLSLLGCGAPDVRPSAPCPEHRSVTLAAQEDIARLAGCTRLSTVEIRSAGTLDLRPLGALAAITGDLVVGPTIALEELSLLELAEVGGSITIASNSSLRGVFLPRLVRAGRIAVEANASVTTLSFPRLAEVHGSLLITGDSSLEIVDLSGLRTIGKDLVIADNPQLALIEAASLATVLDVRIDNNRALPAEQVADLRARMGRPPTPTP